MKRFLSLRSLIVLVPLALLIGVLAPLATFANSAPGSATTSSAPCVFANGVVTTCQSSNPDVSVELDVIGNLSQCTWSIQVNWGDGTMQTFTSVLAQHVYTASSGTFQIQATGSILSGPCEFFPGSYQFTLVPHSPLLSLTTTVTPKTPMWNIDAQVGLDPTQIACPAALTVTITDSVTGANESTTTPDICGGQATAATQNDVYVPVFDSLNPKNNLTPGISSVATAQLTDANHQQSSLNVFATIPPAPIWVGLGDSFASGHHQTSTQPRCLLPILCVKKNDLSFSWLSHAVDQLNAKFSVPLKWQMTPDMEARSGDITVNILVIQDPNMKQMLAKHQGSWNVVSLEGGADDTAFADDLETWYRENRLPLEPWDVHSIDHCVDTEAVWLKLQGQASSIIVNLDQVVSDARQADPNVRIATVDYPFVMNAGNVCEKDYKAIAGVHHGAASVIKFLDALLKQIDKGGHIARVDLQSVFGTTDPLKDIQTLSDWGYPHPNPRGEQAIATSVVSAISGL